MPRRASPLSRSTRLPIDPSIGSMSPSHASHGSALNERRRPPCPRSSSRRSAPPPTRALSRRGLDGEGSADVDLGRRRRRGRLGRRDPGLGLPRAPTEHQRRHRETECDRRPTAIHADPLPRPRRPKSGATQHGTHGSACPADPTFRLWTTGLGPRRLRDLGHTRDSRGERPLTQQSPTGSRTHEAAHRPGRRRSPERRRAHRRTHRLGSRLGRGELSGHGGRAGHGDQRLPRERARPGHDRERPDLLLALPPRDGVEVAPCPADHAQPRVGRLADQGPRRVRPVPEGRVRRAVVRPARLR